MTKASSHCSICKIEYFYEIDTFDWELIKLNVCSEECLVMYKLKYHEAILEIIKFQETFFKRIKDRGFPK